MSEDKVFPLDDMGSLWREFEEKKALQKANKKWIDQVGEALKQLAGGARTFTLGGRKAAMLVSGQLNRAQLAKEQPEIIKQYTRLVSKEIFDEETFKADLPHMYEQYRAVRLVLSGETE